jgi:hypothetical protein
MTTSYDVDKNSIDRLLATNRVGSLILGTPLHGRYRRDGTTGLRVTLSEFLETAMDLPVYSVDAAISDVTQQILRIRSSSSVKQSVVRYLLDRGFLVRCRRCWSGGGVIGVDRGQTCSACLATFDQSRMAVRRIPHRDPPDPALLEDADDPDLQGD